MNYENVRPKVYRDTKFRATGESYWGIGADIFGGDWYYEKEYIGKWLPDLIIYKFPGLNIKDHIYAEIKSVEEVNSVQYRKYVQEVNLYNLTILLIGKFPSFINNTKILDMMPLHMATSINLKTYKHSFLTMGINLDQKNIFGLVSDDQEVFKTIDNYKIIIDPYQHEALRILIMDVYNIYKFSNQTHINNAHKIRHGYNIVKQCLLERQNGSTVFINTAYRDDNMNFRYTLKDTKDEVILSTEGGESVNIEFGQRKTKKKKYKDLMDY